jgi:hypothetical protein
MATIVPVLIGASVFHMKCEVPVNASPAASSRLQRVGYRRGH